MVLALILVAALLGAANVYDAAVMRVVDGDTVNVRVSIWPDIEATASIRVRGIDTPELRGKCQAERDRALLAKRRVEGLLPVGAVVTLRRVTADKYGGRYDADVYLGDGRSLADIMIADGHARPYKGEKRAGWCG